MVMHSVRKTLEEVPKLGTNHEKAVLLVWSSSDRNGVARVAESLSTIPKDILGSLDESETNVYLQNIVYTLSDRRSLLNWRSFAVVESLNDLEALSAKMSKAIRCKSSPKLGYVFTGQGAQYPKMSETLLRYSVFHDSLRKSEMYLNQFGCRWSLLGKQSFFCLSLAIILYHISLS